MDTITVPYEEVMASRLSTYFVSNIFYKGGPTFTEWLKTMGIKLNRAELGSPWTITFKDSRQYTMFMLKYSA